MRDPMIAGGLPLTTVYLAVREMPKRLGMHGVRKWVAELRVLHEGKYGTGARVGPKLSKEQAIKAARALAKLRRWQLDETKQLDWDTRVTEDARRSAARLRKSKLPPPLLFTEFVAEMHEILREVRETQATHGRAIELYYGDMMRRLEDAVALVNERVRTRGR